MAISKTTDHAALKAALEALEANHRRPALINMDDLQVSYRTVNYRIPYALPGGGYGYVNRETREYFSED